MNKYECIALFRDDVTDNIIDRLLSKINEVTNLTKIEKWGVRQLAYPIKKYKKAYYIMFYFKDATEDKVTNQLMKDKEILRFVCVKKENNK